MLDSPRILLPANRLVEIDRMLRLAAELKQPVILYGGRETFRPEAAALLKKVQRARPAEHAVAGSIARRRSRRGRQHAHAGNPRQGSRSRRPCCRRPASNSRSIPTASTQPRDLQRAVKKAIDAGLSREDALRALTLSPAEIYGVADRLGSIEKGKIANLVVTRGDIFDDRTKVEMIFVDGRKYAPAPEHRRPGRTRRRTDDPGVNR